MKKFSLIGAAGYIAPRHIRAIHELGHELISVFDPIDSSDKVKSSFPQASVYTDFTLYTAQFRSWPADYVVICSPNHLHHEHITWALQNGANVICEKPLVLRPEQLDELRRIEKGTGKKVFTVLQLRYLDVIINLKKKIDTSVSINHEVNITHITPRDEEYFKSWKGMPELSGGILTNIGIHLFDLLIWIFGSVKEVCVSKNEREKIQGELLLEKAKVNWFLSVDKTDLPQNGSAFYRKLVVNGEEISLENGLDSLHRKVYEQILLETAPGVEEAFPSIDFCNRLINKDL